MCNADTGMRKPTRRQAGYTFLEIVIVLGILSTIALITEKAMLSTAKTGRYLAAVRKVTERGHNLVYEIREHVTSSRKIFFDDKLGRDYLESLDLQRAPMVEWARLPTLDESGRLGPDKLGEPKTGNVLFFVGESDSTPAIANPETKQIRYIDTYHFVCIYPSEADRFVIDVEKRLHAHDLVVWQGSELPDYAQIMAISDPEARENVIMDLQANHGHTVAWDPTGEADNSFYRLEDLRATGAAPLSSWLVTEDDATSRGGRLVYANVQLARADSGERRRRPIFSTEPASTWLPHGFEVKIIGASGARQVWYHLVIEAQSGFGEIAVHSSTIVANAKDL